MLIATLAIAGAWAFSYRIESNSISIAWSIGCQGSPGPICLFFGGLGGNTTYSTYSVRVLDTGSSAVSGIYLNTTIASQPAANIIYALSSPNGTTTGNQTIGWLTGPFSLAPNVMTPIDFQLRYNGTYGSYRFVVNAVA